MDKKFAQEALDYHALPVPGKLSVTPTKPCATQAELALAYTPGVAEPVCAIVDDPAAAYKYTNKGNLVAVISNGSAVLGLGNTGALSSKPVLEGKAVLFKHFADVDVYDIEIDAATNQELIDTIIRIAPTFGGINLEDIKAPDCFVVEKALRERLNIPVFHDDQHGAAVIISAGLLNALELQGKNIQEARIVCLGAGAAGISSMELFLALGARQKNLLLVDSKGVIHDQRDDLNEYKQRFARNTEKRTLVDAMENADVFIGVAAGGLVNKKMIASMAEKPVIFALSNPEPEIHPELAHQVRDDLIVATGRSDYPNQVNNVLCFPFIFRGALDVCSHTINQPMLLATVEALRSLTHVPVPQEVLDAYGLDALEFGPDYIIPKPLDPRLIKYLPVAIGLAAAESGVARTQGGCAAL